MFSIVKKIKFFTRNISGFNIISKRLDNVIYKNKEFSKEVYIELNKIKKIISENDLLKLNLNKVEVKLASLELQLESIYIKSKNSELKETKCKNLLLTTYPESTTKNVGDAMITDSFRKLLMKNGLGLDYVTVFRGTDLDKLNLSYIKNIFAPGFSVAPSTYPKNYKLFKDLDDLNKYNFIPLGCSYQHYLPEHKSFSKEMYDEESVNFLQKINEHSGSLPVRDELINKMLKDIGVDSYYCGDLVLFDPDNIGKVYQGVANISKVAFSIQHKGKYVEQSKEVLNVVRRLLPDACIYITFHGEENKVTDKIREYALENDIQCIALSGESSNLSFYDDIDFHVGYRLHGHISFLRRRKPSVLIVEDARAYGFSQTNGTELGCFIGLNENRKVSETLPDEVNRFIVNQMIRSFKEYSLLFERIDYVYEKEIKPLIYRIKNKIY